MFIQSSLVHIAFNEVVICSSANLIFDFLHERVLSIFSVLCLTVRSRHVCVETVRPVHELKTVVNVTFARLV